MYHQLTLEESLSNSHELWTWLADTGARDKSMWPGWDNFGTIQHFCFTCEYARQQRNLNCTGTGKNRCAFCVSYQLFGDCRKNQALGKWEMARTVAEKKKYAQQVLNKVNKITTYFTPNKGGKDEITLTHHR